VFSPIYFKALNPAFNIGFAFIFDPSVFMWELFPINFPTPLPIVRNIDGTYLAPNVNKVENIYNISFNFIYFYHDWKACGTTHYRSRTLLSDLIKS
jgi:hypothetical protein